MRITGISAWPRKRRWINRSGETPSRRAASFSLINGSVPAAASGGLSIAWEGLVTGRHLVVVGASPNTLAITGGPNARSAFAVAADLAPSAAVYEAASLALA